MTRRTALSTIVSAPALAQRKVLEVRGIYGSPNAFWATGVRLEDYGVNAVFVHSGAITAELMTRAAAEGARVFAELPTLNGKDYVERHPEAWPIDARAQRAPGATWFMGACPTEPAFRAWRMKQLQTLLERFDIAGVWMDYFHFHAQFEDPNPILPETCFSPTCLASFERSTGIRIPPGDTADRAAWIMGRHDRRWRDWRCRQLLDWAAMVRDVVSRVRPGALLGLYHCPWTDTEFNGARRRILGLDLEALAGVVDVFSPMVYHGRMRRRPEWVGEYVKWLSRNAGRRAKIWPIVQAHNDPQEINAVEFDKVLRFGASGRSTGIMMFTAQSVAADTGKMAVMRRRYLEWEPRRGSARESR